VSDEDRPQVVITLLRVCAHTSGRGGEAEESSEAEEVHSAESETGARSAPSSSG
jgi:hypothetical protein